MQGITRRRLLGAAAATGTTARPAIGFAQGAFPNRPVRIILPGPPGSSSDVPLRAMADSLQQTLAQPIVIDNRPGAGGMTAATQLLSSRPDGHTLGQLSVSVFRIPFMAPNVAFDPLRDCTFVAQLGSYTFGVAVRFDSFSKTWDDLVAWARRNPDRLNYAVSGIGTSGHIAMEIIGRRAEVQWSPVPYSGSIAAVNAVLSGSTNAVVDAASWAPMVRDGTLRLLAVATARRAARYPDVPTFLELGYGYVTTSPYGIAGPRGLDAAYVSILERAFAAAVQDPKVLSVMTSLDQIADFKGAREYEASMREFVAAEHGILEAIGLLRR